MTIKRCGTCSGMRNSFRIVTPKVIAGLPGTWLPISVIIKDSISEGGGIGLASVGIANGMEFPARHLGAIKIAIFIIANGRWCKKCRLIGFHGQRAISVLLAKQWPGLHPNGGNRLSHIREPELFCRFSHLPQFCDNISAAATVATSAVAFAALQPQKPLYIIYQM